MKPCYYSCSGACRQKLKFIHVLVYLKKFMWIGQQALKRRNKLYVSGNDKKYNSKIRYSSNVCFSDMSNPWMQWQYKNFQE